MFPKQSIIAVVIDNDTDEQMKNNDDDAEKFEPDKTTDESILNLIAPPESIHQHIKPKYTINNDEISYRKYNVKKSIKTTTTSRTTKKRRRRRSTFKKPRFSSGPPNIKSQNDIYITYIKEKGKTLNEMFEINDIISVQNQHDVNSSDLKQLIENPIVQQHSFLLNNIKASILFKIKTYSNMEIIQLAELEINNYIENDKQELFYR